MSMYDERIAKLKKQQKENQPAKGSMTGSMYDSRIAAIKTGQATGSPQNVKSFGDKYRADKSKQEERQRQFLADRQAYRERHGNNAELMKYDLSAGQKEIDELNAELSRLRQDANSVESGTNARPYAVQQADIPDSSEYTVGYGITNDRPYAAGMQVQRKIAPTEDRIEELERLISKKQQDFNLAKHYQEKIAYEDTVKNADFDQFDDYVESDDDLHNWINDPQFRESYEARFQSVPNPNARRSKFVRKGYDQMNASEIAIYNYYYAKSGKEAAQKYLDNIQETLNTRVAKEMYGQIDGNTAAELVFGISAGVNQFGTNVMNNFKFKADYIPQSAHQIASGMVREDLGEEGKQRKLLGGNTLAQVAYDAVTTTANMVPSILVGVATGGAAGTAMMGLSAAGGAYQQALNEGFDKSQARGYSIMVGASEVVMEKLLGGISAVGGNALGKNAVKNIANADTALKAIAKRIGSSMLSEFKEEYLQEILDPVFRNIMLKTGDEVKLISAEAIYSGILGALTGAFMEAPFAIYGESKTASTGRKLKESGSVNDLAKIGNTFAPETVAYQLAGKVTGDTGAYTIGQLFNEVNAKLTEQNISEIAEVLAKEGVGENTARQYAAAFAYVVEGGTLPNALADAIEADTKLANAARQVLFEDNTTWNQRSQGYRDVLKKLAEDTVKGKTAPTSKASAPTDNTAEVKAEIGAEGNVEAVTKEDKSAPSVKEIVSLKNGTMKLRLDDGSEVDSGDASYGSDSEALVYETIAQMTNDVQVANILVNAFQSKKTALDADVFAAGLDEAFRYGKSNIPRKELASSEFASKLNVAQQDFAYRMGQRKAGQQVAKNKATVKNAQKSSKEKTAGKVHFDRKGRTFDKTREASLKTMEQLSALLGTEFYVYESYVNKDGQRVYKDADGNEVSAPNGFYDPETGAIHIDLNAGAEGNGTMIFTVAHELTHFIKHWSDDKFKVLANFLVQQYGEKDVSVSELVQKQMDKAKRNGRSLTWDEAYEEMVADSMESMLTDGNVVQMMADLKQQDKTLWQKICDWFKNLANDLKELVEAYKGYKPDSPEGKMVADMQDTIVILESIYADALAEASENFQRAEKNTTEDGGVKMQARSNWNGVTQAEIDTIQNIGRISVNAFTSKDLNSVNRYAAQYWNLMGVKSPFFRAWFGDWRANDQKTPVHVANQVGKNKGIQHNDDTGWDIQVSSQVFNETNKHNAKAIREARPYLPYVNDIVKKAILLDSNGLDPNKVKSQNSLLMHSMYAVADIGNGPEVLRLYVEEMNNPATEGTSKRAYQLQNIEKAFNASVRVQGNASSSLTNASNAVHTVADLFAAVKTYDSNFSPNPSSKIANADGTPKVMYHGSPAQFTIFDKKKAKSSGLYGKGFYFTDSESQAGVYGNKYAVYLNIRNPLERGRATVDRKQVRKFLETVAENEDYSIENYGTYDVDVILKQIMGSKGSIDAYKLLNDINATAIGDLVEATELFNSVNGTEFDGIVVPTEVVAFRPEQIKSATDNIGTFDSSNPDIRYSDRDPAAGRVNEVLQDENAKLKEDVQYLKDLVKLQKTVTGGTKFTKTSVEAMAGNLMKANNVKGNKQELAKLLNGLYEYIAKGEDLTWDGVKEMAQPAVQWLRKNTVIKSELSEYAKEILHTVRTSRIALDESQMAEVAYRYGSYNDFRKAMMGSVIVSKDGVPLDIQWQEWASAYPDIFDANITASDMPGALSDAISSLRNSDLSRAEYAYHADMIEQDLLQQVYDGYWRVSTLYTVADVKQREINALKGKHRQKMNDLRQFHREKTDLLKQEHRDEVKRIRKAYREDSQKKQQEIIQRYQDSRKRSAENRNKTAMRHKIQNVVNELNSLLLANDKKRHVPDNLKKAVAAALDLVNMDTLDAENRAAKYAELIAKEQAKANPDQDKIDAYTVTMENILRQGEKMADRIKELHAAYEEIKSSEDPDIANAYDPVISGAIQELAGTIGNTSLKNMTMEQLSDVYDVYRMVLTRVRDANKAMAENVRASIEELAKATIREVQAAGGSNKYRISALDPIRKFDWDNLKPVSAMERIGSSTLTEVFNNVRAGEDTWAKDVSEARAYYLEKSKKYGYDKWDFDKKYRFESNSGIPFELTLEQILSLYAYSKREQAADHLRLGGFVFDSNIETVKEGKSKLVKYKVNTADAHQITPEIMADIIGNLTKEQALFVDEMQDYLSTVMGAKGNEVTSKMYGVKLFKEKFYFPLKSAKQFMFEQNEVSGEVRIKNSGFTNKVVAKANKPVILSNFMDVWSGHVNDMSMYHAFTLPLEDFNRVFNYNTPKKDGIDPVSVKGTIQNAYSPAAVQYVKNLITDLNGGARTDSTTGVINKLTGLFKRGAVFASFSVVVQQPSAIARAAALIDTKYFIGPRLDQKRHKYLWEEVKQYAPVALIKEMGYFDTNMGKSTQDYITGKEYEGFSAKMKALVTDSSYRDEILSKAPALADEVAWCSIWEAVKRETKAKNPDMDTKSDAFLKLAGSRFTEVITKTQVYDSVLARSANMRSKDTGMKMATAFMAEPTTSINMIEDAIMKGRRGDKRYARTAIGAVIASQIINSILVSFVYAGRDDDEDETYWEKYVSSFTGSVIDGLNPATYIPFIKDIISIVKGYDVERSDMAVISDLWNAIQNLKNDKVSPYRKVEGFVGSIAQMFGLPVKNIMKDVRGFYNTIMTFMGAEKTTWAGMKYAVGGAITGNTKSNKEQLYEARLKGYKQHASRVAARYEDADSADAAVKSAIKDSFIEGKIDEATALKHMIQFAGMEADEAHWTMDAWKYRLEKGSEDGYAKYDKLYDAVRSGENLQSVVKSYTDYGVKTSTLTGQITEEFKPLYLEASSSEKSSMKTKLINAYVACGTEREKADDILEDWAFESEYGFSYSKRKQAFLDGDVSREKLIRILMDHGYTNEDARAQIEVYEWEGRGIEDATVAAVREYNEYCALLNVPKDIYLHIRQFSNDTENDVDPETGKSIYYSAMKKVMAEIDAQRLTPEQKTAIARSLGWSEKNIQKYKLW